MIAKRSGKSCRIYSQLQVKMEWVQTILHNLLKINHAGYSSSRQGFPTVPQWAWGRCAVNSLFTWIDGGEWKTNSRDWWIDTSHSTIERISADICLKTSPWSYMKHTAIIKSCCTVSIAILNEMMVRMQILHCSTWSSIPTLTTTTQLASMWSISGNIQHLPQQQSQHKIHAQYSKKEPFATSGRQIRHIDKLLHMMRLSSEWNQNRLRHRNSPGLRSMAQLTIQNESCGGSTTGNTLWSDKGKVESIKEYMDEENTVECEWVQEAKTAIQQAQDHVRSAEILGLTSSNPETKFERMLNAIGDSLSDLASPDNGDDRDDEDDDDENS